MCIISDLFICTDVYTSICNLLNWQLKYSVGRLFTSMWFVIAKVWNTLNVHQQGLVRYNVGIHTGHYYVSVKMNEDALHMQVWKEGSQIYSVYIMRYRQEKNISVCVCVYSHVKKHWKDIRRLRGRHWELGMRLLTFFFILE